ncbi:YccS family putative transporter [Neisseria sp. Ec49-e6-T10]|uniref:YccS family putative transporter n=1 Tax=Neisseria sp. Ec49-e6-T10 TaxID=3140744 RepID=UPI003EC127ED
MYCLRIFIALSGVIVFPWLTGQAVLSIPLILGVVAAGLSDLDDRITGRLRNLLITLICFFTASASVELLFPYPWLFAFGLLFSTCGFILIGSLGQRYSTIAFGALLIALYTMLGHSDQNHWYTQPTQLVLGALWYNIVTLVFYLFIPIRPIQDNLSRCFEQLAIYLEAKSTFFDPDEENHFTAQKINIAMVNKTLVEVSNLTKTSLMSRLKSDRGQKSTRKMLSFFFIAQDIYERTSSAHVDYQKLSEKFRYSDVLFRFQRILMQQSMACTQIADAILARQQYTHNPYFERSFKHLENTLNLLKQEYPQEKYLVYSMQSLLTNLRSIDRLLVSFDETAIQEPVVSLKENLLQEDQSMSVRSIWIRITQNLTAQSPLFRHSVRMSIVLLTGYLIAQLTKMPNAYWIMLTSLFVCQPNYSATKYRLKMRLIGTFAGVLASLPIIYFIPSTQGQILLIIISGVLFFSFRSIQYAYATSFITLMILLSFNVLDKGFVVPFRLLDTLIGCTIAWAAVHLIWPDWQFRKLSVMTQKITNANCQYLSTIQEQYHTGKNDHLAYITARDFAHTCDSEMASVVSNMTVEPKVNKELLDRVFRLICLNHTLLGYISALGAHRTKISSDHLALFDESVQTIIAYLQTSFSTQTSATIDQTLIKKISEQIPHTEEHPEWQIFQQINLILELLPELTQLLHEVNQEP